MTRWADNFDDNYLDPAKWQKIEIKEGTVSERNMRIEFSTTKAGDAGGIISRDRYDLTKGKVVIYMASVESWNIKLQISPEKATPPTHPDAPTNRYYILLNKSLGKIWVSRELAGKTTTLYEAYWAAPSNVFRIEIEAGYIRFYEGDKCVADEPYQLPSYECYIYAFSTGTDAWNGTDWADDFDCEYAGTAEEKSEAERLIVQAKAKQAIEKYWGLILALTVVAIVVVWVAVKA